MRENLTSGSMRGSRGGLLDHYGNTEYALHPKGREQARVCLWWLRGSQTCSLLYRMGVRSLTGVRLAPIHYSERVVSSDKSQNCVGLRIAEGPCRRESAASIISVGRSHTRLVSATGRASSHGRARQGKIHFDREVQPLRRYIRQGRDDEAPTILPRKAGGLGDASGGARHAGRKSLSYRGGRAP